MAHNRNGANSTRSSRRRRFVLHARVLEHIRPLPTGTLVAVLQMLPEVIGTEELLRLVALAELVDMVQVFGADVPLRRV